MAVGRGSVARRKRTRAEYRASNQVVPYVSRSMPVISLPPSPSNAVSVRSTQSVAPVGGGSVAGAIGQAILGSVLDRAETAIANRVRSLFSPRSGYNDPDSDAYARDARARRREEFRQQYDLPLPEPVPPGRDMVIDTGDGYTVPVNSVQVPPVDRSVLPAGPNPHPPRIMFDKGVQANYRQLLRDMRNLNRGTGAVRPLDFKERRLGP